MGKNSEYYKSYFKQFLSPCVIENFKTRVENNSCKPLDFNPHNKCDDCKYSIKHEYCNKIKNVYNCLRKIFPQSNVVISGGFVTFLEGISSNFEDVDIFISTPVSVSGLGEGTSIQLNNERSLAFNHTEARKAILRLFSSKKFREENKVTTYPMQVMCNNYNGTWLSLKINSLYYYEDGAGHFTISYNIICLYSKYQLSWIDSVKLIFSSFDTTFCRVALCEDFKNVVRFQTPSLFPTKMLMQFFKRKNRMRSSTSRKVERFLAAIRIKRRARKYLKRVVNFASPLSLFNIVWMGILKNFAINSGGSPGLKDILSYSDFSKGTLDDITNDMITGYLARKGYVKRFLCN